MWIIPNNISSAFVQDTLELNSDLNLPGLNIESSLMWRSKPSLLQTWSQRWNRVTWFRHLCGRILKPSHAKSFVDEWTASLPVIRVSHSATPDNEKELMIRDTSGLTSDKQLELFSPGGASLRTSKGISRLDSPQSLQIWKKMVTEQRGEYSRRKKLAHHTEESGSLSWLTPRANEPTEKPGQVAKRLGDRGAHCHGSLSSQVKWPTPKEQNSIGGGQIHGTGGQSLDVIVGLHAQEKNSKSGKLRESMKLNPAWVAQLMGLTPEWISLGSWVTESYLKQQQKHGQH